MRNPTFARRARGALVLGPLAISVLAPLCAQAAAQASTGLLRPPTLLLHSDKDALSGDVNGDGHLDVIAYQNAFAPAGLQVHLGDGLGGFAEPVTTLVAPARPRALVGGDFDGDGRTDLAFVVEQSANLQVLRGASDGSFVNPLTLPLSQPGDGNQLTVCDANGDGHLDLVASQAGANRLTLYKGIGNGGFVAPPSEIIAIPSPSTLSSGDFDGDGATDLLVADDFPNNLTVVLWGQGNGLFGPAQTLPSIQIVSPVIGDLNGDGRDDIALLRNVVSGHEEYWSWQPKTGFSATQVLTDYDAADLPVLAVGDVDRDGVGELLAGTKSGLVELFQPQRDGTLAVAQSYGASSTPAGLHVTDLDADGAPDVFAGGDIATILSGQGDGLLQGEHRLPADARDMAVADVTGDGLPDVVAVFGAGQPAQLLRGRFDGGLELPQAIDAGPEPEQVWLVDATGDGLLDLVASGGTAIAVVAGHANGSFDPPVLSAVTQDIVQARLAEFGGDGLPDLALMLHDEIDNQVHRVHFLIDAGGSFTDIGSTQVTPPGGGASSFLAADVDGDLDTDLLVRWSAGYLRVFINQPTGFEPALLEPMTGAFLGTADFDDDGDIDFAKTTSDGFEIRFGDGGGGFPGFLDFSIDFFQSIADVACVDVDGDGLSDLVASGSGGNTHSDQLSVSLGLGNRGFAPFTSWDTGAARFARPADLNHDGATDLAVLLEKGQLLTVENGEGPWSKLGHSLAGEVGFSRLQGFGPLTPGSPVTLRISNGLPGSLAFLVAGPNSVFLPFKGGVLVPQPLMIALLGALDAQGGRQLTGPWPAALPPGASFAMQVWRPEPRALNGFGATTAIRATAP